MRKAVRCFLGIPVCAASIATAKTGSRFPWIAVTAGIAVLSALPACAVNPEPTASVPAPVSDSPDPARAARRGDRNSMAAHEQLVAKAQRGGIDVYFLGDSITRRWGATDYPKFLEHWKSSFHGWNAANFGWGGDTVENILWRVENGELDGVNPKVIVLLAGTNNVGALMNDQAVEKTVNGIDALLKVCRAKAPGATIVLMAVFPRNDKPGALPLIGQINQRIERLADGKRIRFLNINRRLAAEDGTLVEGMAVDKLHLGLPGYEVWASALKPILRDLLGPPASVDTAPPPTGDPGLK